MLNNSCPRCLTIRVIDCRISLKIRYIQNLVFKPNGTILQISQRKIKVCINGTGVNNLLCQSIPLCLIHKIVLIYANFNSIQKILNQLRISSNRNSLIQSIKIIVIKRKSYRKSLNNKCRKIFTITSPLFLCIAFYELLIDISSYQRDRLLLKIPWLALNFFSLLLNLRSSLLRCHNSPHLIECIHVKRHRVQLAFVISNRRIGKSIKCCKTIYILPHLRIVCMENMCPIFVEIDSFHFLRINISRNIRTLVNNKDLLSGIGCLTCKNSAK